MPKHYALELRVIEVDSQWQEEKVIYTFGFEYAQTSDDAYEMVRLLSQFPETMKALEALTPQGSDYYHNPKKCLQWIEQHQETLRESVIDHSARRHELSVAMKQINALAADVLRRTREGVA